MSAIYEIASEGADQEGPLPPTSGGNSSVMGDNSTRAFQHVVLGVHSVFILALVGISTYLLLMPITNVFCLKDNPDHECQTFQTVLARLTTAETEVTSLTTELANLKSRLANETISPKVICPQGQQGERCHTIEAVMKRLNTTETEVTRLKGTLAKKRTTSSQTETVSFTSVLFSAKYVDTDNVVDGAHIRFALVTENIGRGYNPYDGVFTAPYSGSYLFHTSICAKEDKWVYVNIMAKGNSLVTIGTKDEDSNGVCSSASAITFLHAGEKAWVQGAWNETAAIYSKLPYSTPTFCGTLLHASL